MDHAKSFEATYLHVFETLHVDEKIVEFKRLWEMARISLLDEAITYKTANQRGGYLDGDKGHHEEAKAFYLAALKGRKRVLVDEHKETIGTLNNLGDALHSMKDYEGALDYYQKALRGKEKVLGKTHPDTLDTIEDMVNVYMGGLKDSPKAERCTGLLWMVIRSRRGKIMRTRRDVQGTWRSYTSGT